MTTIEDVVQWLQTRYKHAEDQWEHGDFEFVRDGGRADMDLLEEIFTFMGIKW